MSRLVIVIFLIYTVLHVFAAPTEELYEDKYDYIDVDAILKNPRIRNQYYNCFLDTAPCLTPDAKFFKDKFPESIVTQCRRCTERQKESFQKIVEYYVKHEPEKWEAVIRKAITESQKKSKNKKV